MHELEDEIRRPADDMDLGRTRMLMALLTMLGRPGIWPKSQRKLLQTAALKISRASKEKTAEASGVPMTMDEHRKKAKLVTTIQDEVETLRRFAGVSNRKNKIGVPESWGTFWS